MFAAIFVAIFIKLFHFHIILVNFIKLCELCIILAISANICHFHDNFFSSVVLKCANSQIGRFAVFKETFKIAWNSIKSHWPMQQIQIDVAKAKFFIA